jgi:hypothetical protein
MGKFMREFIEDIWATDDALEAWRRGDTDWPLSLKQGLAYLLMVGVAFVGGVSAAMFFWPAR